MADIPNQISVMLDITQLRLTIREIVRIEFMEMHEQMMRRMLHTINEKCIEATNAALALDRLTKPLE